MGLFVAVSPTLELVLPFPTSLPTVCQRSLRVGAASIKKEESWDPLRVQGRELGEGDKGSSYLGPTTFPAFPHTPTCPNHPNTLISQSLRPLLARPAERPSLWGPAPLPPRLISPTLLQSMSMCTCMHIRVCMRAGTHTTHTHSLILSQSPRPHSSLQRINLGRY